MKKAMGEMIKKGKKGFLARAMVLFFLLPVLSGCPSGMLVEEEEEEEEGEEYVDPYVSVVNPFIGVWKETNEKFWQFRPDGTGGKAATADGPFRDDFSFFVHIKQAADETGDTSLVLIEDDISATPPSPPSDPVPGLVKVTRYTFTDGHHITLTPAAAAGTAITLEAVDVSPQALSLTNPLIGEWATKWSLNGTAWASDTSPYTNQWSLKYRADGTVKTYHHSAGHQFENAYALRGSTLVIYGQRRFCGRAGNAGPNPTFEAIKAEISSLGNDSWRVQEWESWAPAQNPAKALWIYTKVDEAKWKPE